MVRRHTYENIGKTPSNDTHATPPPPIENVGGAPSRRSGYENVQIVPDQATQSATGRPLPGAQQTVSEPFTQTHLPHFQEEVTKSQPLPPTRSTSFASPSVVRPQSHTSSNHAPINQNQPLPQHNHPEGRYQFDTATSKRVEHRLSASGNEYAVVEHRTHPVLDGMRQQQQQHQEVGVARKSVGSMDRFPPVVPLRAFQRMGMDSLPLQDEGTDLAVTDGSRENSHAQTNASARSTNTYQDMMARAQQSRHHDATPPEVDTTYDEIMDHQQPGRYGEIQGDEGTWSALTMHVHACKLFMGRI